MFDYLKTHDDFGVWLPPERNGEICFGPLSKNPSVSVDFTLVPTATAGETAVGYFDIGLVDSSNGTGAYVMQLVARTNKQVDLFADGYPTTVFKSTELLHLNGEKNHAEIHMSGAWFEVWLNGQRLILGLAPREDREYSISFAYSGVKTILTGFSFAELKGNVSPAFRVSTAVPAALKIPSEPSSGALKWFHDAFVTGYLNQKDHRNPAWDQYAINALSLAGRIYGKDPNRPELFEIMDNCRKAVSQGCKDPLVLFVYGEMLSQFSDGSSRATGRAYKQAADNLSASKYHPLLQFIILNQCICYEVVSYLTPVQLRASVRFKAAAELIPSILADKNIPVAFLYESFSERLNSGKVEGVDRKVQFDEYYTRLQRTAPDSSLALTAKGCFYVRYAWDARGSDWARNVTPNSRKLFHERLAVAKEALTVAWKADPNNSVAMAELVTVEMGNSDDEGQVNAFSRAIQADKTNFTAYSNLLNASRPRWGGSCEYLLAFGKECFESIKADPSLDERIGRIFVRAHELCAEDIALVGQTDYEKQTIEADYWHAPDVWRDVQDVYGLLLKRCPNSRLYKSEFANYAVKCEHWDVAGRLLNELGAEWATAPFGGPEKAYAAKQKVLQQLRKVNH
jgi:hypothetical protein